MLTPTPHSGKAKPEGARGGAHPDVSLRVEPGGNGQRTAYEFAVPAKAIHKIVSGGNRPIENSVIADRVNAMNPNKLKDQVKDQVEDLQDEAAETARSLTERAAQWQRAATDGVVNIAKNTDSYVHENPWPAIGLAAVFAFALGLWIGTRRD